MYESPFKPKYAIVVEIEPVAAHYYQVAGLSPLYLTPEYGVHTDVSKARTYSSKSNAKRSGERAKRSLWGIRAFQVEQINPKANDGPPNVKVAKAR